MRRFWLSTLFVCCACGGDLPGNSPYQGLWTVFAVNGSQVTGGVSVDDHGRFQFQAGDAQVSGAIAPGGKVSGAVTSFSTQGTCALAGSCASTSRCTGVTSGAGCPGDAGGAAWTTFALCRAGSC